VGLSVDSGGVVEVLQYSKVELPEVLSFCSILCSELSSI
jgi:hypothetical protein